MSELPTRSPKKISGRKPLRRPDLPSTVTPEKRRRSEQRSPEVAIRREAVKDVRAPRHDHHFDDDAPSERRHKSRKQKRIHTSPSLHHSKHRKEQRQTEKQRSMPMISKEGQEAADEKAGEQSRKRKRERKHRHDSLDSEETMSKHDRSLDAAVDHQSRRRESSCRGGEKYRPPSNVQPSPKDDFDAHSSSVQSEVSTRFSSPRDSPSPRRRCLERQADPERTARFPTSGGVYRPASHRAPNERSERAKRKEASIDVDSPVVEVSREKPPKSSRTAEDRGERAHRSSEKRIKDKGLLGEVQRTQPLTESPPRSFNSGACEETGSGPASADSFRSRHRLRPSTEDEASLRRSARSPKTRRRSKARDDLLSESSREGVPQTREADTRPSERRRHRREEKSRADAPRGVSKTDESPQSFNKSKAVRSRSTSEHSTDPSNKLEPEAKPGFLMSTPEPSSTAQSHHQSPSPKKRISTAGSSGATSLLGLIDMLSVEETSDTELEALLPPTILSGEHAKLCMPSSSKQVLQQQQQSKDVLSASGLSATPDFQQAVVNASAALEDGASGRSETAGPVSSDTVLDRLSTRLQAKMLTVETWLEGEDLMDEDIEAAVQPAGEETEEDEQQQQQQTVFGLVSTSAALLTPRQRLLTSLATPWQEFETAGELGEKDLTPSSPPPSCLPEQPIGAQILCLTGVSRRYLGEALTKQLEARLSSSASKGTPLLSRHPIALFHRRCVDKSPGPASPSLPLPFPAPTPMSLTSLVSLLSHNHPQLPTAVAELTLRRHLLGLQAC
ncbi:hypothetical protein SprV_0301101500 [Sparganum proliferum]